ncbi:MAG: hypothetical protein DMG75_05875 [Acidobacteria bacterium]|nr:MAG: hypothetical protein DMG75_05875 [Acidobacteriota bacterium]
MDSRGVQFRICPVSNSLWLGGRSFWSTYDADVCHIVVVNFHRFNEFRRFFTGAGDAASYPNATKIVAFWTSEEERGIGSSLLLGGVGAGGIFAPILLSRAIERWGWRSSFVLCGLLAVTIALVWFLYSTNRPEEHRGVNSAELNLLGSKWRGNGHHSFHLKGTPWGKLLASRSVWGLILSYFCHGYTPYIFFTWFFI